MEAHNFEGEAADHSPDNLHSPDEAGGNLQQCSMVRHNTLGVDDHKAVEAEKREEYFAEVRDIRDEGAR